MQCYYMILNILFLMIVLSIFGMIIWNYYQEYQFKKYEAIYKKLGFIHMSKHIYEDGMKDILNNNQPSLYYRANIEHNHKVYNERILNAMKLMAKGDDTGKKDLIAYRYITTHKTYLSEVHTGFEYNSIDIGIHERFLKENPITKQEELILLYRIQTNLVDSFYLKRK